MTVTRPVSPASRGQHDAGGPRPCATELPKAATGPRRRRQSANVARALCAGVASAVLLVPPTAVAGDPGDVGEAIYRRGVLASGAPLEATRTAGGSMAGAAAACVNCHQRSGFGGREGRSAVPPITGRYLSRPLPKDGDDRDIPYVEGMRGNREPYTDELLARAIREGLDPEGNRLSYLMPNYGLGDRDMAALIAYLKRLDQPRVPGVTDSTLHFATIITPDADPAKRAGVLDVMKQFFADRNVRQMTPAPNLRTSGKTAYSRTMFMVHRRWELHVWELTGPESTWQQQLEERLAREPVFAVLSGLGGRSWAPVHAFCERAGVPCLFPNIELPVDNENDFYPVYFSKGVLLEAGLMAKAMLDTAPAAAPKSVAQIYRAGDVGEAAAAALADALRSRSVVVVSHVLPRVAANGDVAQTLRRASGADALVLWLRPQDLAALGAAPAAAAVYASGLLGGLERAPVPPLWRDRTRLTYPFDLPERRRVRIDFALGWFAARHIPVVAEQVQADTYLALGLASEVLKHMVDAFSRDYLVERMVSEIEHRIVTGYYPRLALATGQRFASKGGYLVRWSGPTGTRIVPDGDWIIP
jgi:hypothetical protein